MTLESQKALGADITNRLSFIFMACLMNEPATDTSKHMLLFLFILTAFLLQMEKLPLNQSV